MGQPLNELENLFVSLNIRFAIGVRYKKDITGHQFHDLVQSLLDTHPLFAYKITSGAIANILSKRPSTQTIHPTTLTSTGTYNGSLFQDTVYALVHSHKSLEDVNVTILTNERLHEHTVVFNFSHALIDARGAANLLSALTLSVNSNHHPVSKCQPLLTYSTEDFSKMIPDIQFHDDFKPECYSHSVLKFGDAFRIWECTDSGDVAISIEGEYAKRVHSNLRQQSATFTGLWLWALFKAMTELVSSHGALSSGKMSGSIAQYISVSVLVDIRPQLKTSTKHIRQAFGTVRLIRRVDRTYDENDVFSGSMQLTSELKAAVLRGDALRSAKMMCNGQWEDVEKLEGTVELSNHGVYDVPSDAQVAVTQRYDGYRGLSIIFWSEKGSGDMKAVASYGGVKKEVVVDFMSRLKEIIERSSIQ